MSTSTHLNRPILTILLLLFVIFFLTTSTTASATSEGNRTTTTSRNFSYRTHRFVPMIHHPYYVSPHRSCDSFTRPYARSMCLELQRIHRSSRKQPLFSPPPPPPSEIDPRYGVDKRLVPSGPNPLHN
ncbi:hypothetical protein EUTSA_v10009109mg [Eutrema salsugineum]|uniref:Uncharacterized protein n=1 Tax=Eutrema salsugineum TaxID=72664 RepID=V4KSK1_EUTSA|nr:CLAVATA3/ESR (CLE)-related protein 9 [Eutrema salsugineum]ESQ34289.1 hypothetical protein EUTSA_v10009109mg [Eutrema salsugineum]